MVLVAGVVANEGRRVYELDDIGGGEYAHAAESSVGEGTALVLPWDSLVMLRSRNWPCWCNVGDATIAGYCGSP